MVRGRGKFRLGWFFEICEFELTRYYCTVNRPQNVELINRKDADANFYKLMELMPQGGVAKVSHSYFVTSPHAHTCRTVWAVSKTQVGVWYITSRQDKPVPLVPCYMKDASYCEFQWQVRTSPEAPQKGTSPDSTVCAVFCTRHLRFLARPYSTNGFYLPISTKHTGAFT